MADTTQAPDPSIIQELNAVKEAHGVEQAKNRAANQTIGEIMNANLNLRAATFLHEQQNAELNAKNAEKDKEISSLRKQIADLEGKLALVNAELDETKLDIQKLLAPETVSSDENAA